MNLVTLNPKIILQDNYRTSGQLECCIYRRSFMIIGDSLYHVIVDIFYFSAFLNTPPSNSVYRGLIFKGFYVPLPQKNNNNSVNKRLIFTGFYIPLPPKKNSMYRELIFTGFYVLLKKKKKQCIGGLICLPN